VPISEEMLKILCCPMSKTPVRLLTGDEMDKINKAIETGQLETVDGDKITHKLEPSLITQDKKTIYEIDDGIPNMLIGSGIPANQIEGL